MGYTYINKGLFKIEFNKAMNAFIVKMTLFKTVENMP